MFGIEALNSLDLSSLTPDIGVVIQLVILGMAGALAYDRLIRRSKAEQLFKGMFIMLLIFVVCLGLSYKFNLTILTTVFSHAIQLFLLGLIVIFQPELRRILLYIGQPELIGRQMFAMPPEERETGYMVRELVEAVRFLSKSRTGSLIVLETQHTPEGNYLEAGTPIDGRISTELLLTIFHTNTPLHDGALVIDPTHRIAAAGVLLPLTEDPKLSWQYGTRHRAAIGLSEVSDSRCIVVSEETGTISLVEGGHLEKLANADELQKRLEKIYRVSAGHDGKGGKSTVVPFGEKVSDFLTRDVLPDRLQQIFLKRNPPASRNKDKKPADTPPAALPPKTSGSQKSGNGN